MAAPFSTFRNNRSRTRRSFTLQEANRSLPLVARIVRDIVNTHERATQLQARLDESPIIKEAAAIKIQLDETVTRLQNYVDELTRIGVALKDYGSGLIDFPGRHKGRDVYLCWMLGEKSVSYWHELHTGYGGRQPISTLQED